MGTSKVVALSGHGVHFKGDRVGYFCPVDAKLTDKGTLIPMEGEGGLFDLLKACPARRKLPRPGTAELVIAFVGLAVWCLVGYGIAVAAGFAPLPLGP